MHKVSVYMFCFHIVFRPEVTLAHKMYVIAGWESVLEAMMMISKSSWSSYSYREGRAS